MAKLAQVVLVLLLSSCSDQPVLNPPSSVVLNTSDQELVSYIQDAYEEALRDLNSSLAVGKLAMIYDANGFKNEAVNTYSVATQLDTTEFRWPYLKALAEGNLGQISNATKTMTIAIDRNPDYVPSYLALGFWLNDLGDFEQSNSAFNSALPRTRTHEDTVAVMVGLAQVQLGLGNAEAAQRTLSELSENDRNHPYIEQLLIRISRELGIEPQGSEASHRQPKFEQISWSDPISGQVVAYTRGLSGEILMAQGLMEGGRIEDARSVVESLVERYPNDPRPVQMLSTILTELNFHTEAEVLLKDAVDRIPDDHLLRFHLALIAEQSQDTLTALQRFRESRVIKDDFYPAYEKEALIHIDQAEYSLAEGVLLEAVKRIPNQASASQLLGILKGAAGEWQESVDYLNEVVEIEPTNAEAFSQLALARLQVQDIEGALQALLQAKELGLDDEKTKAATDTLQQLGILEPVP